MRSRILAEHKHAELQSQLAANRANNTNSNTNSTSNSNNNSNPIVSNAKTAFQSSAAMAPILAHQAEMHQLYSSTATSAATVTIPIPISKSIPIVNKPNILSNTSNNTVLSTNKENNNPFKSIQSKPPLLTAPIRFNPKPQSAAAGSAANNTDSTAAVPRYFQVMYAKRSAKVHKTFDDGILTVIGRQLVLESIENRLLAKHLYNKRTEDFSSGTIIEFGNWLVEILNILPIEEYLTGRVFMGLSNNNNTEDNTDSDSAVSASKSSAKSFLNKGVNKQFQSLKSSTINSKKSIKASNSASTESHSANNTGAAAGTVTSTSTATATTAKSITSAPSIKPWRPDDPEDPNTFVLNRAAIEAAVNSNNRSIKRELPIIVEGHLSRQLRPHQRIGVQFLYDCIIGNKNPSYSGCILADDMGLGKSLQSITLMHTLLTNPRSSPLIKKGIIVCPSTLVQNWIAEFKKWLGTTRCKPITIAADKSTADQLIDISTFINGSVNPIAVLSYELFRKHSNRLKGLDALIVCDEGHRLKNSSGNKTIKSLESIESHKRLILTGTPCQNNLSEFYSMCQFVNPGYLNKLSIFRATYEYPISKSRDSTATTAEKIIGEKRANELSRLTQSFVLRRSSDILMEYLPAKIESVLFCQLTQLQIELYKAILKSKTVRTVISLGNEATALTCINSLKKVSNHPILVYEECKSIATEKNSQINSSEQTELSEAFNVYPIDYDPTAVGLDDSVKLSCLDHLLQQIHYSNTIKSIESLTNKVVVVSNYTKTLNLIERLFIVNEWGFLRLDGNTRVDLRQSLVDRFNSPYNNTDWIFLLSAKSGGLGLNLIGADRLILFDPEWNPAVDLQCMARIWRDGQRSTCYIYRLLTAGTIDEKIFQRQLRKQEVAQSVVDDRNVNRHFNKQNLKLLFLFKEDIKCDTYSMLIQQQQQQQQNSNNSSNSSNNNSKSAIDTDLPPVELSGNELVVGGLRWQVYMNNINSTDPLLSSIPAGLVNCIFTRNNTDLDTELLKQIQAQETAKRLQKIESKMEDAEIDTEVEPEAEADADIELESESATTTTAAAATTISTANSLPEPDTEYLAHYYADDSDTDEFPSYQQQPSPNQNPNKSTPATLASIKRRRLSIEELLSDSDEAEAFTEFTNKAVKQQNIITETATAAESNSPDELDQLQLILQPNNSNNQSTITVPIPSFSGTDSQNIDDLML